MRRQYPFFSILLFAAAWSPLVFGHPNYVPSAGAPADGGRTCAACHKNTTPDPGGSLTIQPAASSYTPGTAQKIRVTMANPNASNWTFQLTARALNDPSKAAGTLAPADDIKVYCAPGPDGVARPAPCNGAAEFAIPAATATDRGSKTWEINWTPPLSENGRIRLYASGLAREGTSQWAYATYTELQFTGACPLTPQIGGLQINSVENAASNVRGAMGLNSLITVKGRTFAEPATMRVAGPGDNDDQGRYPTRLACVTVLVNGNPVPLTYVAKDQVNAQAPTLESGTADVQVVLNRGFGNELRSPIWTGVPIQSYSPAFFTFNGKSIAAQIWPNYTVLADPAVVAGARAAKPGEYVILYGTGFGATKPVYQAGEVPSAPAQLRDAYTVTIGGIPVTPIYAGIAPGLISGAYQINFQIPANAPDGDLPVVVDIGGQQTQSGATITVRR